MRYWVRVECLKPPGAAINQSVGKGWEGTDSKFPLCLAVPMWRPNMTGHLIPAFSVSLKHWGDNSESGLRYHP